MLITVCIKLTKNLQSLYIHPSIFRLRHSWRSRTAFPGEGHGGRTASWPDQTSRSPATDSNSAGGIPRRSSVRDIIPLSSLQSASRSLAQPCLEEHYRKPPGGILIRCLNHLSWLLSTRKSSDSTLRSSRIVELLTPSRSDGVAVPPPYGGTSSRLLILAISSFRSLPKARDHRWGQERRRRWWNGTSSVRWLRNSIAQYFELSCSTCLQ